MFEEHWDATSIPKEDFQKMLDESVERAVENAFNKFLIKTGILPNPETTDIKAEWVSMKELLKILPYSKQTIYNWRNDKNLNIKISPFIKKVGSKTLYKVEELKACLRNNGFLFGKNQPYSFKEKLYLNDKIISKGLED